jgi:hypothetical protein
MAAINAGRATEPASKKRAERLAATGLPGRPHPSNLGRHHARGRRPMLLAIVIIAAFAAWGGIFYVYYKQNIISYFDNRFGPDRVEKKAPKPPKKRMYE